MIEVKRRQGRMIEALVLARLGARVAAEAINHGTDTLSRCALTRYLELMPEDPEARHALAQLPPEPPAPARRVRPVLLGSLAATVLAVGAILLFEPVRAQSPSPVVTAPPVAVIAPVVPPAEPEPIVIRAVGDVVLGSNHPANRLPGEADLGRIVALREELGEADILIGNLEGVLADGGTSRKETRKTGLYTFRMPEGYGVMLQKMGFDVLSLANNHSLDFGRQGLHSTLGALRAAGIQPVGVPGAELAQITVRGTTVAFLNYSYLPAFAHLDDETRISAEIAQARNATALVVVTVHGGKEGASAAGAPEGEEYFMNEYRGDLRRFARLAIDAGADAVFGHGPHVVRPYELYDDKPIFYSLGNFVGYRSLSTRGKLANSIVAEVRFKPNGTFLGEG